MADLKGGLVIFDASHEAASEFSEFGELFHAKGSKYTLFIDHRFDAKEVIEYTKNYGKVSDE